MITSIVDENETVMKHIGLEMIQYTILGNESINIIHREL